MTLQLTRRKMAFSTAAVATASTLIPSRVLGANNKLNVAFIGVGNRGETVAGRDFLGSSKISPNINAVAICDVNLGSESTAFVEKKCPLAKKFKDFRVMFDKMEKEIDAVVICTPDHSHFPASMMAMALGKHVYVEKPMAHTYLECKLMMKAEQKYKVVTQMGNQGHSEANYFQFKAWTEQGIIKDVTQVDAFMNYSRRWHKWGHVTGFPSGERKPETLDWDLWLSTAPEHPFSSKFHPGNWRGWYDYGTGCLGDWGAHIVDTVHEFLELGLPKKIVAKKLEGQNEFIYPMKSIISFEFAARNSMPALTLDWYDGSGNFPSVPEGGDPSKIFEKAGKLIYSKNETFLGGSHGDMLQIFPRERHIELLKAGKIQKSYPTPSDHYLNFVNACLGTEKTRSPFSVGGPLTKVFALGCISQRLGGTLEFDTEKEEVTNNKVATQLLSGQPPRKGWEQFYKI